MTWCQPSKSAATVVERERDQTAPVGQAEDDDERRVADIRGAMTRAHANISQAVSIHGGDRRVAADLRVIRGYIDRALSGLDNGYFPQRLRDAEKRAKENQDGRSQALRVLDEVRCKRDALAAELAAERERHIATKNGEYQDVLVKIKAMSIERATADLRARVEMLEASESAALEVIGAVHAMHDERAKGWRETYDNLVGHISQLNLEVSAGEAKLDAERVRVVSAIVAEYERMKNAGRQFQFDAADIRQAAAPKFVPVKAF